MSKWWFVINADEAILLELETVWSVIEQQTEWTLGRVLRYPESESDPVPAQPSQKVSNKLFESAVVHVIVAWTMEVCVGFVL